VRYRRKIRRFSIWLVAFLAVHVLACSDDPVDPLDQEPEFRIESITNNEFGPFIPDLIDGDREFNGHGPLVTLNAELYLQGDDSLMCRVYMEAVETEYDWTTAEGEWEHFLYQAPDGWRISGICANPPSCQIQYIDDDNDQDWLYCKDFIFRSQGDTDGEDVGSGTSVIVIVRCTDVEIQKY
jgi:hypothetical protein